MGNALGGSLATAGSGGGDAGPAPIASPGQILHDDQTYAGVVDNPYQANDAIELRQRAGDPAPPPPQAAPTGMTSEVAALLHSDAGYAGKVDNPYQANDAIELRQRAGDLKVSASQQPVGMTSAAARALYSDAGYAGKVDNPYQANDAIELRQRAGDPRSSLVCKVGGPPTPMPSRTIDLPLMDVIGNPTGFTTSVPVPDSQLIPGDHIKGNLFFGGAGMDGPYIKDMVRAFGTQGIALTPVDRSIWSNGTILDATIGVQANRFGELPPVHDLQNFEQCGSQFNLIGYSYGSEVAAQIAVNYARGGTTIDNLVLIGSPISADYLKTIQSTPNINNVIVVNLTAHGDPIYAGMSDLTLAANAFTLAGQMPAETGHFYYAPQSAAGQANRDSLAQFLYNSGVR